MSKFWVFCLVVVFCLQMSSSKSWSYIHESTGANAGNVGILNTYPDRSSFGGYLHGDFGNPPGFGFGMRRKYQRGRFDFGVDLNTRFLSGQEPLHGVGLSAGVNLGRGWHLGATLDTTFQSGRRPDIGGGITFKNQYGKRRRRSIGCMTRCVNACKHSSKVCQKNCIVTMC